jgi:DNA polymerase III subunit alpha
MAREITDWKKSEDRQFHKTSAFTKRKDSCEHPDQPFLVRNDKPTRRLPTRNRPMHFRSLHHHSTYSYLDGYALPSSHVRRATELNMESFALTEHGNLSSHVKFEQAAKKEGVKPIFGVELYCGQTDDRRQQLKNHLTVLAETPQGYQNLLSLVTESWEQYYYEPTVDWSMLKEKKDGLIVLSGCNGSLLFTRLMGGKGIKKEDASFQRAKGVARSFKQLLDGDYYIEVQAFPELDEHRAANPALAQIGNDLGIPLVATLDCHYTIPTEKEIQQVLHNVRGGHRKSLEDLTREWGYKADLCPPTTDRSVLRKLRETGLSKDEAIRAILNTEEIAERCKVDLPRLPMIRFDLPPGYKSSNDLAWDWLRRGWKQRGCDKLKSSERRKYVERVKYEMSIIEEKDFIDYFLVVAETVQAIKDKNIGVGPARGSAAASLVCWLLRITEVNPMLFPNLVFERFIDLSRMDLPDIDLDFESARRSEITDFLIGRYGEGCVSNIGTFTMYKSRMALDDTARAHNIPRDATEGIKSVLIERSSGDLRASATIEDTIEQFVQAQAVVKAHPKILDATKLEGNAKTFGTHAAGLVVSNQPISEVCAVITRKVNGHMRKVVGVDKFDAEYLGLLKLDLLGLNTLDMLVDCCSMIDKPPNFLYTIPITDDKIIEGFQRNDVVGVFQFDGRAVRSVNGSLKPDTFQEVCDITALARPGPLHNGSCNDYIDIKRGRKKPHIIHGSLSDITSATYHQIIYQEQILRIVREIGNFSWTDAAYIRKIISKKLGDAEFNRQWSIFWSGVQELHPDMSETTARAIWGFCITAGSYAFNNAHAVSYGYIAWWTMYFKMYHPEIFFTASLRQIRDQSSGRGRGSAGKDAIVSRAKIKGETLMLRDADSHGFVIDPPDIRESEINWKPCSNKHILAGFRQIPGVGDSKAQALIDGRDSLAISDWDEIEKIKGFGPKTSVKIQEWVNQPDPFGIHTLRDLLNRIKLWLPEAGLPAPTHTAIECPYDRGKDTEVVFIGIALHRNLRDIFEVNRARTGIELKPEEVTDPHLNEWCIMALYDGTELLSARFTRFKYPKFRDAIWGAKLDQDGDVILVKGIKTGWRAAREIIVNHLWVIDPQS